MTFTDSALSISFKKTDAGAGTIESNKKYANSIDGEGRARKSFGPRRGGVVRRRLRRGRPYVSTTRVERPSQLPELLLPIM